MKGKLLRPQDHRVHAQGLPVGQGGGRGALFDLKSDVGKI